MQEVSIHYYSIVGWMVLPRIMAAFLVADQRAETLRHNAWMF